MKFHALSNDGLTFEIGGWEVGDTSIDAAAAGMAVGPWYGWPWGQILYLPRVGDTASIWGRRVKELVTATATDVENKSGGKTNERPIILLVDLFLITTHHRASCFF